MTEKHVKYVSEVIKEVGTEKVRYHKLRLLAKNESWALKDVLRGTYDNSIRWNLPGGEVPYTPAELSSVPSSLFKHHMDFKYYARGGPGDKLSSLKRETMFIRMLESIHPDDAEVVCNMINKQAFEGITKKLVQEAFPDLIRK